jgi:hypothetical protein
MVAWATAAPAGGRDPGRGRCVAVGATAFDDGRGNRPPPAVGLWPELAVKLHQAPDPSVVRADVRLDVGGRLFEGHQVDAEQLRALFKQRRDRPAQVRVVLGPHPSMVSNTCSR